MKCYINEKEYFYHKGYQNDEKLRLALDELAQKVFHGLTFKEWYKGGYWTDKFIPYTLFDEDKAVANVLVVHADITCQGEEKHYIQLSTVMVDVDYRGNGLLRFLMKKVMEEWQDNCDSMYLYANDRVLDFYPLFGFKKEKEYQYSKTIKAKTGDILRLDLNNKADKELIIRTCRAGNPYADINMGDSHEIIMFHCLMELQDHIYYLPQPNVIVIAKQQKDKLICYDIYGSADASIEVVLPYVVRGEGQEVVLGFTPEEKRGYSVSLNEEADTLFVLEDKDNIFEHQKLMLPTICHA